MKQCPYQGADSRSAGKVILNSLMKPEGSLSCWKDPATEMYPESFN
jgi:hypothetical protein